MPHEQHGAREEHDHRGQLVRVESRGQHCVVAQVVIPERELEAEKRRRMDLRRHARLVQELDRRAGGLAMDGAERGGQRRRGRRRRPLHRRWAPM